MNLERNNQGNAKKEKLVIYIGRSTEFVSLETVLHVYQFIGQYCSSYQCMHSHDDIDPPSPIRLMILLSYCIIYMLYV